MLDMTDSLNLLRIQHQEAIKHNEFQKAKSIKDQINYLNSQIQKSNTGKRKLDNQLEYARIRDSVRSRASDEYTKACKALYEGRNYFQNRLSTLISTQSDEIQLLATNYAKALELSTMRPVVESNLLEKEARVKAKYGGYGEAQQLFDLAANLKELTTEQRQEEVHKLYDRLQDKLKQKHREELALNSEKRYQAFVEIKLNYDREVDRMKKFLSASAIKLQVEQDLEEEAKLFHTLNISKDDNQELDVPRIPLEYSSFNSSSRLSKTSQPSSSRSPTKSPNKLSTTSPSRSLRSPKKGSPSGSPKYTFTKSRSPLSPK